MRVPAKINLHLGGRRAAPGRLPRTGHGLPRRRPVRRGRSPGRPTACSSRSPARAPTASRPTPTTWPGGPPSCSPTHAGVAAERRASRSRKAHPGRRRHGRRLGRRRRRAARLRRAVETWTGRAELAELAAELGSDVAFPLTGGTALGTGRGELLTPGADDRHACTGCSRSPTSASPPATAYRELDRLRAAGAAPRPRSARRTSCSTRCARGDAERARRARWRNDLQAGRAVARARRCATRSTPGVDARRARPASSPAPGRPARSCAARRRSAATGCAAALAADGVCRDRPGREPARSPGARGDALMADGATSSTSRAVGKAYGTTTVLDGVSLGVADGERIGVVGRNGGGKSTLLRLIIGAETPDSGRVTRTGGVADRRASTSAATCRRGATVRDVVVGDARRRTSGPATPRCATVLAGLGLAARRARRRRRPALRRRAAAGRAGRRAGAAGRPARARRADQPPRRRGHHLAGRATSTRRRGALLVVTHDRWFLDAVCARTWEVGDGDGAPVRRRLRRVRPRPGRAGPAGRRDRGAAAEPAAQGAGLAAPRSAGAHVQAAVPHRRGRGADRRRAAGRARRSSCGRSRSAGSGAASYDLEDVTRAGRRPRLLLDHVTWHVGPGDRIGVIGVNGSGKTHLLRLLAGELQPDVGHGARSARPCTPATCRRRSTELPDELRVLEAVQRGAHARPSSAASSCRPASWPSGSASRTTGSGRRSRDLSGGERRRLQLLRLLLAQPNVLLLDEPTNDLDTDTLAALEDLLDSLGRHARRRQPRPLPGRAGLRHRRWRCSATGRWPRCPAASTSTSPAAAPRAGRRAGAATSAGSAAGDTRAARKELTRLERQVATLDKREATLHDAAGRRTRPTTRGSPSSTRELREVVAEREAAEEDVARARRRAGLRDQPDCC